MLCKAPDAMIVLRISRKRIGIEKSHSIELLVVWLVSVAENKYLKHDIFKNRIQIYLGIIKIFNTDLAYLLSIIALKLNGEIL